MIVAVIGSRDFNDFELMKKELLQHTITQIISGGARGADALAERYALEHGIPVNIIKPDWRMGRHAGLLRNKLIIEAAESVIAFWDGASKGTQQAIRYAEEKDKPLHLIRYAEK